MVFCFKVATNFISVIRETLITRLRIWLFSKQKKQTFEFDFFLKKSNYKRSIIQESHFTEGT